MLFVYATMNILNVFITGKDFCYNPVHNYIVTCSFIIFLLLTNILTCLFINLYNDVFYALHLKTYLLFSLD